MRTKPNTTEGYVHENVEQIAGDDVLHFHVAIGLVRIGSGGLLVDTFLFKSKAFLLTQISFFFL